MPTLSRLHKPSNRSQNALIDQPPAAGAGTGEAAPPPSSSQGHKSRQSQQAHPPTRDPSHQRSDSQKPTAALEPNAGAPPSGLLSSPGFSSSESSFVDPRLPLSNQQQQPPPPAAVGGGTPLPPQHQQIYGVSPDTTTIDSPVFDNHRQPDFIEAAVNRSQSHRYSTYAAPAHRQQQLQQDRQYHQQAYDPASTSLEYLPGTAVHTQVAQPQPEKKSKRGFIKNIFSGGSKSSHSSQQQAQAPPPQPNAYDNTSGLARRPSRRESAAPAINTRFSQQPGQLSPDREWHAQQGSYSVETSPLPDVGEVDEYQYRSQNRGPESDRDYRSQDSRHSLNPTIRPVVNEPESPYDDSAYHPGTAVPPHQQHQQQAAPPPHHPPSQSHQHQQQPTPPSQQPHVQPHQQDQAHRHDQAPYSHQQALPGLAQQQKQQQQQQQQLQYAVASAPPPYQEVGESLLATGRQGGQQQQQSSDTVSKVSHESPVTGPDQRSTSQQSAQASPSANYGPQQVQELAQTSNPTASLLPGPPSQQSSSMTPSSGGPPPSSRDNKAPPRGDVPPGAPPGYRHSNSSMGALNVPPGQPGAPRYESPGMEQGRNSPQPDRDAAEGEKAFKELLTKYKNVKRLYFDGKSQIENLTGQVEQLQNAVANQRLAQSRTALDDNEYSTRFNRLNGAINNLSFNIRKDWRCLPPWLSSFVSPEALKTGKQEMTAVGRAVVSRWLVEELFHKCFHPGLEPLLSAQLKEIELNIRGNAYMMHSQEEFAALTTKVVHWRMATLDGLQRTLNSEAGTDNRQTLISKTTTNLTAYLYQFLSNPPPAGVEGSTSMIVELAVGIAANLPMESRDVAIMYPLPGDMVRPDIMEVEKMELPALEVEAEAESDFSDDEADKNNKGRGEKTKSAIPKDSTRVRFAGFPAWEVRGRQVLMKAPVWTL